MTAIDTAWMQDRILWRAQKSFEDLPGCYLAPELPAKFIDEILVQNSHKDIELQISNPDDILVLLWGNRFSWTLLSSEKIYSCYLEDWNVLPYEAIDQKIKIMHEDNASQIEVKFKTCQLALGAEEVPVWAPPGPGLFGLMNLLQMVSKLHKQKA